MYNIRMNENKFFTTNLRQITVTLAIYVPVGSQKRVHIDRADHGFFLNVNAESVVGFDTGKTITVKNGQIGYLPRSSNYTVKNMSGSGGCYAINFLCPPLDGAEPFVVTAKNRDAFVSAFRKASQAFLSRREGYNEVCLAMLAAAAARIKSENAYVPSGKAEILRPALDCAHENYTDPNLTVPDLAAAAGISEVYLRRLFLSVYGEKPSEYITNLRLNRAKELLKSKTCGVGEAAALSGFGDVYHFSRLFKREVGVTPSEYSGIKRQSAE